MILVMPDYTSSQFTNTNQLNSEKTSEIVHIRSYEVWTIFFVLRKIDNINMNVLYKL